MKERAALLGVLACCATLAACSPVDDVVFETLSLALGGDPVTLREGAGAVQIPLKLSSPARSTVSARVRAREIEAQSTCKNPDFVSAEASVVWNAGQTEASVDFWVGDDALAEIDERAALQIFDVQGAVLLGASEVPILIEDDDRSGIIDAQSSGVVPSATLDQSASLQQALDRAFELGRGVVLLAPGDYVISSVTLHPGTTLSARGAALHRPAKAAKDAVTLNVAYRGAEDSAPTLVEGLRVDGQRDAQGDYQAKVGENAHLLAWAGNPQLAGHLNGFVESVELESGTGSGVFVGPQANLSLCRVRATDLYRDAVTLRGGDSSIDVRELDASASLGTTGMWFSGQPAGNDGLSTIQVTLTDTRLASGDLEIEAYDGSTIALDRVNMTRGPFRLLAPNAHVQITNSVIQLGIASSTHNYFGFPHDVALSDSTLVVSETDDESLEAPEAMRTLSAIPVRWDVSLDPTAKPANAPHQLSATRCTFQRGADVDSDDLVYGADSSGIGGSVVISAARLAPGVSAAIAPNCTDCSVTQ